MAALSSMQNLSPIQFLENEEIDKRKWDECVTQAANGLIYARTFYLDNISPGWKALVGQDYEWVLPLTNKTKYGIPYLSQPPFTQQLGVFSKPNIPVPYAAIFQFLQQHYKFCEINLNYATPDILHLESIEIETGTNYILDLSNDYATISARYRADLAKNLKRSRPFQFAYQESLDYKKAIQLYRDYYGNRMQHVKHEDYEKFYKICSHAFKNNMLVCREAVNKEKTLLAADLLLFDGRRLYNLMNTTTGAGRKSEANHFLLDAIIQEFAGREIIFDFEGSDLPGVKSFYENFGGVNEPYFKCRYNKLNWPLRLFKK